MVRRRKKQVTFSLFAFQDIITSVTGIMILATLMLAVEFIQRIDGAPPRQTEKIAARLRQSLEESQSLEQSIAEKGAHVKAHGLGGAIIWTIGQGHLPNAPVGSQDPVLKAAYNAIVP